MCGEDKMKFNSNFNFGIEIEIVWCVTMCEIVLIILIIYHVEMLT
jgi:hypothetical protein